MREGKFSTFSVTISFMSEHNRKRVLRITTISSFILCGLLVAWSCLVAQPGQYEIDKPSPTGSYRARVHVKRGDAGGTLDQAKFEFLIGKDVVNSWEWKQEDQYERAFDSFLPIEWVSERVLEMGGSKEVPFYDELTITNSSGQDLKYLSISYGKSNIFMIFELASGAAVSLRVSPHATVKGQEFSFGYGGMTKAGKQFTQVLKVGERVSVDGPKKISLNISPEQIQ